jgi:hypothetical protein
MTDLTLFPPPAGGAVISADGVYRYELTRRWDETLPVLPWVCLNPSTADADVGDPSVRRMCGFARREGCGGIRLLNEYGLRTPNPYELLTVLDPVGPDNDRWLTDLAATAERPIVVAWGSHPLAAARAGRVCEILAGSPLVCLGLTSGGAPRHPLYLRADAPLIPYRPPA